MLSQTIFTMYWRNILIALRIPAVRVREWNRLFSPFDTHLRMVTVEWNCSKHGSGSFGFAFLCSHLASGTGTGFNTLVDDDENESRPPPFVTRARRNDAAPAIISPRVYAGLLRRNQPGNMC